MASQSSCTHRQLTRYYDHKGLQTCMVCHRVPDFGYLYRCTQDTNGSLPITDFLVNEDGEIDLSVLRMAVEHDINDAMVPLTPALTTETTATTTMANNTPIASSSGGETYETHSTINFEAAVDENLAHAYDGKRKFEVAFPPPQRSLLENCELRICHACRPTYRDRAWQSMNQVVDNAARLPPFYELDNRRVSDADVVRGINQARPGRTECGNVGEASDYGFDRQNEGPVIMAPLPIRQVNMAPAETSTNNHRMAIFRDDSASDADDERGFTGNEMSSSSGSDDENDNDNDDGDNNHPNLHHQHQHQHQHHHHQHHYEEDSSDKENRPVVLTVRNATVPLSSDSEDSWGDIREAPLATTRFLID